MRILLITEYFPGSMGAGLTGGIESRCFNVALQLAKKNSVVVLTSWREGLQRKELSGNLTIIRAGHGHRYSNSAGFLSRIRLFFSFLDAAKGLGRFDIIDAYNWTSYAPAFVISKKLGCPVVATYHETWVGEWIKNKGIITGMPYELYERALLRLDFSGFISVSEFTKSRLSAHGISEERIKVIPNGIDSDSLKSIKAKKKTCTIIFIGRLIQTKNVDVLLKAVALATKEFPELKCRIIGQGPEADRLKKIASRLKIDQNVEFLGFVKSHRSVMAALKSSHIYCNPSSVEGFGITLLEAMALGVPYVCSDILPFSEITENMKGGLLSHEKDHKDLAEKIVILIKDKRLYLEKIKEGNELIKKYRWDKIADEIIAYYKKLASKRK